MMTFAGMFSGQDELFVVFDTENCLFHFDEGWRVNEVWGDWKNWLIIKKGLVDGIDLA